MLNPHHDPVGSVDQQPPLASVVQDQVITTVASMVRMSQNPQATSTPCPSGDAANTSLKSGPSFGAVRGGMDHAAAWLMFGLTVACLVFLAYLVTIDKTDLKVGIPATMGVVLTLNAAVFGTRTIVHKTRKAAAAAGHAVADALDPPTGSDQ